MNWTRILPAFSMLFFFASCQPKPGESPSASSADGASGASNLVIYESFDDFAPLLEAHNDTTYVINFWATWCGPCVEEMPYFESLHDRLSGDKVKVILVSLDFKKDIESKLKPFLEERKLKPTVIMLADGRYNDWIDRVSPEWGGAIPATVLIKGDKKQFYGEQFPSYEELEQWVKSI